MNVPDGRLRRSRVVDGVGTVLEIALEDRLTGYVRIEPADALLLDEEGRGVLTFESGIPVAAYHTGTEETGSAALSALAVPGPFRVELYELDGETFRTVHSDRSVRVSPDEPAERLANDPALASRIRERAPAERLAGERPRQSGEDTTARDDRGVSGSTDEEGDTLAVFLENEERIESIKAQARRQARARAEEWGLTDAIEEPPDDDRIKK